MAPIQSLATPRHRIWLTVALLLAAACVVLLFAGGDDAPAPMAAAARQTGQSLEAGVARMDGAPFVWSPGWKVTEDGADSAEPAQPEIEPSGIVTFTFTGRDLALLLGPGDYRGHIYVTVDGAPANRLPVARWHEPAATAAAGYRPLYAPERAGSDGPGEEWVWVHRAGDEGPHTARIEVWRSWGQWPLRAVAVDAPILAAGRGWLAVALLVAALWCAWPLWLRLASWAGSALRRSPVRVVGAAQALLSERARGIAVGAAGAALLGVVAGTVFGLWWLAAAGVLLLAAAGVVRPALWYGALLFALPFYFEFTLPLLPSRAVNLVDAGVWCGLFVALAHAALATVAGRRTRIRLARGPLLLLAALASWALVSAAAAHYPALALREWRTVFLMAAALAAGLAATLYVAAEPRREITLLAGGWLAGAATLATVALVLYPSAHVVATAEGVARLRAFYGSPNNLALYIERTLAVSLALALLARSWRLRAAALAAVLPQAAALLLTFSRGAIFVALPAMVLSLWCVGFVALRQHGRSTRVLWWLAAPLALTGLALIPFLGTERFRDWASLAQGTGFLRLNLWRSAWQMGWDHPLLGVGPDNFLYAYRSGYILPQAWMEPNLNHPHSWPLDWWTRLGLPGLALGAALWFSIAGGLARRLRVDDGLLALRVGVLAATVTALAHGLVDASYALPDLMAVWALFAVAASVEVE